MTMPGLSLDVSAQLCAALSANTAIQQQAEARRREMYASVSSFRPISFQVGTTLPAFVGGAWGPNEGFTWAVQRMTVDGLGTSDYLNVYVGSSKASAVAGNGLHTFTVTLASTLADWEPGRTGMLLHGIGQDALAFSGSVASAVTVSTEVIQVTDAQLPYFLL